MEQRRRALPTLEPVQENSHQGELTTQPSVRYKPHKYGTAEVTEAKEARQCLCVKPLRYFGKLRDRYIRAMNEMAMGGDLTGLAGYHGAGDHECIYALERSRSARDRRDEALQEELAALVRSQLHHPRDSSISQVHPS